MKICLKRKQNESEKHCGLNTHTIHILNNIHILYVTWNRERSLSTISLVFSLRLNFLETLRSFQFGAILDFENV